MRSDITPIGVKTQVDVPEGFGDGRHNDFIHLQNTGDPAPSASLTSVSAKPFWPFPSTAVTPCGDRMAGGFHVVTPSFVLSIPSAPQSGCADVLIPHFVCCPSGLAPGWLLPSPSDRAPATSILVGLQLHLPGVVPWQ